MARNYFAVPWSYAEEMAELGDAEFGRLMRAGLKYSETGEPITLRGNERFYAKRVMLQEDVFRKNYEEQMEQKREAGRASARQRALNSVQQRSTEANEINKKEIEIETEIKTEIEALPTIVGKHKARFTPPTVEEVKAYCSERKNSINAEKFVDYYAQQGWKLSNGNALRDWRAAIRQWERRDGTKPVTEVKNLREEMDRNKRALAKIRGEI